MQEELRTHIPERGKAFLGESRGPNLEGGGGWHPSWSLFHRLCTVSGTLIRYAQFLCFTLLTECAPRFQEMLMQHSSHDVVLITL